MAQATVVNTSKNAFGMSMGKFAMWAFIASDAMGFAGLFAAFVASRASGSVWLLRSGEWIQGWPNPTEVLNISLTALNTFILICSSVTMVLALSACRQNDRKKTLLYLGCTIVCGMFFLGVQAYEYQALFHHGIVPWEDNFCGTFYALTCYHGFHVLSGVIYLICIFMGTLRGRYNAENSSPIEIVGLFWHFVDLVWILLFTFVYLFEPLGLPDAW